MFLWYTPPHSPRLLIGNSKWPLFFSLGLLSLGLTTICLRVLLPLKCGLNSIFAAGVLDAFPQVLNIWDDYVPHTGSSPKGSSCLVVTTGSIGVLQCVTNMVVTIISQLPFTTLFCTLFMAHLGYIHLTSASLSCYNSSFKSPGVVQTDMALWASVPMTLYLADRLWWLSCCRYCSV